MAHVRETAERLASSMLSDCHHDTWTVTEPPPITDNARIR